MSPGSANSESSSMSIRPICPVRAASSSCWSSLSIISSSSLIGQRLRHGQRPCAGELVLGGQLLHLVQVAQLVGELHQPAGELAGLIVLGVPQDLQVAELPLAHGPLEPLGRAGGRRRSAGQVVEGVGSRLHGVGLVGGQDLPLRSSSSSRRASRLGPRPASWLGSRWTARARSSGLRSRMCPNESMCSKALPHNVRRVGRGAGEASAGRTSGTCG